MSNECGTEQCESRIKNVVKNCMEKVPTTTRFYSVLGTCLFIGATVIFGLYMHINSTRTDLAVVQQSVEQISEKASKIEGAIDQGLDRIQQSVDQVGKKLNEHILYDSEDHLRGQRGG